MAKLQLTHYNRNNETQTIVIKKVYNLCGLSNLKQNDTDFIPLSEIKGSKRRRGTKRANFASQKTATKSISFFQMSAFPFSTYFLR